MLDQIARIKALPPEEANRQCPVRLEAYVTYYDARWKLLMVADQDGGLLVVPPDENLGLKANQKVLITGVTGAGGFAPIVQHAKVTPEPTDRLLSPRPLSGVDLMAGQQDNAYVQVRGVVLSGSDNDEHTMVRIATPMGVLDGIVPHLWSPEERARLLDATVQFPAVCGTSANGRRQFTAISLWIANSAALQVLEPPNSQPFSLPVRPMDSLLRFEPNPIGTTRVRVRGVVTGSEDERLFFLQDSSGGLRVQTRADQRFSIGDAVEAVGYPLAGASAPTLQQSLTRVLGKVAPPLPRPVAAAELLEGKWDGILVELEARLLGRFQREDGAWLSLESGGKYFEAHLGPGRNRLRALREGSVLRVCGVCDTKVNERHESTSFVLVLRSAADVQVLSAPSWWTPERAWRGLGLASGLIALTVVWNWMLRRRVAMQTAQIRRSLEHEASVERRYQKLFENAQDFVFTCDPQGAFTSFNHFGVFLTGYAQEEARRMKLFEMVPKENHAALAGLLEQAAGDQRPRAEFEIVTKAGQKRVVELTLALLQRDGAAAEVQGIARDTTERKRMELEVLQVRDLAVKSARHKAEFLANMSHEIRTPMNGVIGMTNLLLDTPLSGQQLEFTQTIRHSAEALLTVVNDILDFSKIEAGKLSFEEADFDFRDMVEGAVDVLAERAGRKGLELVCWIDPQAPAWLRGDGMRVRQVLTNLIGNAVKFTHKGEVWVKVRALEDGPELVSLRFEVCDSGIGISKQVQATLFRPFNQGEAGIPAAFGGTGLGLAISKQLVEQMGGQIGVESEPGQGATFWFTVRLRKAATAAPESGANPPPLGDVQVLVVDDNAAQREALAVQMGAWGLHCEGAESGSAALELLRQRAHEGRPFHLALLDLHLPVLDGLSLAQCIKIDPLLSETRLILLSGFGQVLPEENLDAAGISACLMKPAKRGRLLDALLRAVGAKPTVPARSAPSAPAEPSSPRPLRILLAEDNAINQKVAVGQLGRLGYQAELVGNGRELLERFQPGRYDIVFMDCQMPEMDGYEATRQIRLREQQHPQIPPVCIIAMTAHAMKGDREKCLNAGMDDYISKPIDTQELKAALEQRASAPLALPKDFQSEPAPNPAFSPELTNTPFPESEPAAAEAGVDLDRLLEAVGGIEEEAQALAVFYLEQAREMLEQLDAAITSFTTPEIRRLAHKLAGASASCGVIGLMQTLRELEQAATVGALTPPQTQERQEAIHRQFAATEQFFSSCFHQPQQA